MIKELNKWLKQNEFDTKVGLGEDFVYNLNEEKIYISKEEPDHTDEYMNYCYHLGLSKAVSWQTMCFLHELGHHETIMEINDWICLFDRLLSKFIDRDSYSEFERKIRCMIYYRMPTERAATKWAVEFINENDIDELEEIFND